MAFTVRDGTGNLQPVGAFADSSGNQLVQKSNDTTRPTYRAGGSFTPQATGAVTLFSIQGSATKTVRVKRITVGGVSTGAGASLYNLIRSSALGAGGTVVAPTVAKLDSTAAAATAVVQHYTTSLKAAGTSTDGPLCTLTLGTSIVTLPTTGAVAQTTVFPEGGAPIGQAIVLRGTADYLEFQNKNAGNLPAGTVLQYSVEWEEDNS